MHKLSDSYELGRCLQNQAFLSVYEAKEISSGQAVIIYLLNGERAVGSRIDEKGLNELKRLKTIHHANIVRCLDVQVEAESIALIFAPYEGITLRQLLLQQGALAPSQAIAIARQVAEALAVMHRLQPSLLHGGLQPECVWIDAQGGVKVAEFAIHQALQASRGTTVGIAGSATYMNPEQIDAMTLDPRSDLYHLGILLYEMLNGVPPFRNRPLLELLRAHCVESPPPFSAALRAHIVPELETLVMQLLAKGRESRPTDAQVVAQQLAEIHAIPSQPPPTPPPASFVGNTVQAKIAFPWLAAIAIVFTLLVMSVGAVFVWRYLIPNQTPPKNTQVSSIAEPSTPSTGLQTDTLPAQVSKQETKALQPSSSANLFASMQQKLATSQPSEADLEPSKGNRLQIGPGVSIGSNVEINGQTIASIPRQVTTPLPEIPKPDSVTTNADGTRILLGTEPLPSFPLPLMPGAKIVNVMQVRPSKKSAKTSIPVDAVTYTIEKTAEEVAAFYEPGLKNAGFEVFKTENPSVKGIVLSGRRDKINIAVSALQIQPGPLHVSLSWMEINF